MKSSKAFTLIELLVVIAIIALLVSILLPSLNTARMLAKRAVCSSQLHSITQGMLVYANDNNGNTPTVIYDPAINDIGYSYPQYVSIGTMLGGLGLLISDGILPGVNIAYCPLAEILTKEKYAANFQTSGNCASNYICNLSTNLSDSTIILVSDYFFYGRTYGRMYFNHTQTADDEFNVGSSDGSVAMVRDAQKVMLNPPSPFSSTTSFNNSNTEIRGAFNLLKKGFDAGELEP